MQPYVSDTRVKRRVVNYQLVVGSGHGEAIRYTQNTHIGSMGEPGTSGICLHPHLGESLHLLGNEEDILYTPFPPTGTWRCLHLPAGDRHVQKKKKNLFA